MVEQDKSVDDHAGRDLYVVDAFNALCRQFVTVNAGMDELQTALLQGTSTSVFLAAAKLNFDWSVLDARHDFLTAVMHDDAMGNPITQLGMGVVQARLRNLMEHGVSYLREAEAPEALVAQMDHLATRLVVHDQIVAVMTVRRGEPS